MNKKLIKSAFLDDPEVMAIMERQEQTDLLSKMGGQDNFLKSLKTIFKGDDGYTPKKGEDYFTSQEIKSITSDILKNATPVKFKDYFTEPEVLWLIKEIKKGLKEELTPIKGKDYRDGIDGKNGKELDEEKVFNRVFSSVLERMPKSFDSKYIDEKIKEIESFIRSAPTEKSIIESIKKKKLIEKRDIKDMPLNMNDQRWHGGGLSSVSHDSTLTGSGTPSSPLSVVSSGSGFIILSATGAVNGMNTLFTFTTAPQVIVADQGRVMQKVSSDGTVNWTGTTNVTLAIAPNSDVFGY